MPTKTITTIKAKPRIQAKTRVAAYIRVSNEKESMIHSMSAQISYYNHLIGKRMDWILAGIYTDEGLTGTKGDRSEFNHLLDDCRDRKIDLILTKSISRFARNTVTLLESVRKLRGLGIDVHFERENIHSLSGDGEVMLTILASYAQNQTACLIQSSFREIGGFFVVFQSFLSQKSAFFALFLKNVKCRLFQAVRKSPETPDFARFLRPKAAGLAPVLHPGAPFSERSKIYNNIHIRAKFLEIRLIFLKKRSFAITTEKLQTQGRDCIVQDRQDRSARDRL